MAPPGGSTGRSIESLLAENEWLRKGGWADAIARIVTASVWAGAVVACIYFIARAIESLAGRQTDASIIVEMMGRLDVTVALAWAAGACGVLWGRAQSRLRKKDVERLHARVKELEASIDAKRSSSKLTSRGETNPKDRP